jgi:Polyketide cyclase / dehydrase and lipid transport
MRLRIGRNLPGAVPVDVETETTIRRPRADVAAFACDPDNATRWYENIKAVEWRTPPPLAVGTRLAFVATFLGRRLEYTYEVREHAPGERFVMSTSEGPFPMETTYAFADAGGGATRMTLRNRGEPSGFAKVAAPVMARAMRRANGQDLRRLKEILESSAE